MDKAITELLRQVISLLGEIKRLIRDTALSPLQEQSAATTTDKHKSTHGEGNPNPNVTPVPKLPQPEVPSKSSPERPHWSTFVTPAASVITAALALYISWTSFNTNNEINKLTLRPLVTLFFAQKELALPAHEYGLQLEPGVFRTTGPFIQVMGVMTIRNTGNSPAYNINYKIENDYFLCYRHLGDPINITIGAHDSTSFQTTCDAKIAIRENSGYNIRGRLTYSDGFHQTFNEDCIVQLAINLPGVNAPLVPLPLSPK
jgi:hypothetical protein